MGGGGGGGGGITVSRRVSVKGDPPYSKEQAVRILLGCILVHNIFILIISLKFLEFLVQK